MNSPSSPSTKTRSYILTQPRKCTQCTPRENENTRNIILCIDGLGASTNNGSNNTNVAKLFAKLDLESTQPEQYAYYSGGVDARAPRPSHILDRMERVFSTKVDMAWNTKEIVKDAYRWLVRTYKEGDQIYLFGFSRGAYQVRVFAEMIHEVGLIRNTSEDLIGTAYDCYEAIRSRKSKTGHTTKFKEEHTRKNLRVHFIGVWDTISPLDHTKRNLSLPTSSAHACHFRHALALDELRVNFIPECFRIMNSHADEGEFEYLGKKYISEFKEVWFAGSHSDVGGQNRPGTFHHAGNVSLIWMRREAAANGLVLEPTDIVWLPDDLDFGVNNYARWFHRLQPRRVLPGQKIHASVLYANAYKPKATLGEGFDIPITQSGIDDMVPHGEFWETGLFDGTAARELVASLGSEQGVASIYLDRLLFMLRFHEGRQHIRNVPDWQGNFITIINDHDYVPFVRLVVIVAYFETSCNHEVHQNQCVLPSVELSQSMRDVAKSFLNVIQDWPRVVGLLRPLTKHRILAEQFLTREVLDNLVNLLDAIILEHGEKFGQAMDCLNSLLQCAGIRETVVAKLGTNLPDSNLSRLSRILEVDDPRLLTAALRMMRTLVRVPEAKAVCSVVKPRLKMLARTDEQPLGPLAVEIFLSLYDPNDRDRQQVESRSPLLTNVSDQLDIRDVHTRINLARALVLFDHDRYDSENGRGRGASPAQQTLRNMFGLDATELDEPQRNLIGALKTAVQNGGIQERTAATMAFLKLCETKNIRDHLCNIKLLDVLIAQLRRKDSALLAAYALATCLKYGEMEEAIKDDEQLPEYIITMLKLNYFDDAVGRVEGFQIFKDLMQCADLWKKINDYGITDILSTKLSIDDPKEIRTGLICFDIFLSFDASGQLADDLAEAGLKRLNDSEWKAQMGGVRILSTLAQTEYGKMAISSRIHEIVEMLLPQDYLLIRPTVPRAASPSEGRIITTTIQPSQARSRDASPSWMLGPACALRLLAQNETLRVRTRETVQYGSLKDLFLSGALTGKRDTPAWRLRTPNRADVNNMLDMLIKVVDREQSEGSLISIQVEDVVPHHIQRWDRLATLTCRNVGLAVITDLPRQFWDSVLLILALVVSTLIYVSLWVYEWVSKRHLTNANAGERTGV